jgi:hypothetical protein
METANGNGEWKRRMETANGNGERPKQQAFNLNGTGNCPRRMIESLRAAVQRTYHARRARERSARTDPPNPRRENTGAEATSMCSASLFPIALSIRSFQSLFPFALSIRSFHSLFPFAFHLAVSSRRFQSPFPVALSYGCPKTLTGT